MMSQEAGVSWAPRIDSIWLHNAMTEKKKDSPNQLSGFYSVQLLPEHGKAINYFEGLVTHSASLPVIFLL